jgi:hypothetical protein
MHQAFAFPSTPIYQPSIFVQVLTCFEVFASSNKLYVLNVIEK